MTPKTHVSFEKYENQIPVPFIIYVHFDFLQIPQKSKIIHKPCGFGYSVKCFYDESLSKYEEYQGENSARILWQKLESEARDITKKLASRAESQVLNGEEKNLLKKITKCYFCNKDLNGDGFEDFHPLTGRFLGVAHKECSRKMKVPKFVPVVMNNLSKYGSHFLLKVLAKGELDSIFEVGQNQGLIRSYHNCLSLRFIDLRQFMDEKIEDLEEILADSKKRRIKSEYKKKVLFDLMKKKSYFPYYYVNSFERFSDKHLPQKSGFFDQLHDEEISDEDYQRTVHIWDRFGCQTIGDYFKVYVKSNVFLLEDIFENFRLLCLDKYRLDPAHFFTIASFSWDSMLRYTGVKLELLKDKTMVNFIKYNIRGGLTQCSKRHAKANNIYCNYDKRKSSSYIIYLDANNLGGYAMSQNLPFSDFRWMTKPEIENLKNKIGTLDDNSETGYILEVYMEYPKKLHKLHNDLPFCSQPIAVPPPPTSSRCSAEKPVLSFYDKRRYVIDYRTLQQCLENGLILKSISRVLTFKQCKWLEPYITYNTNLRARAKNDFEINLYKLLNNSVYGKTIQKSSTDKPIYAGFSILELSKKFMYDFHYKHMLQRYDKINLLYIDTDGVIYEIQTSDFYGDVKSDLKLLNLMDTSNLDERWGIPSKNKKVVGKMKDEYGGKIIREFFGVGAKVYFLDVEGEEVKKAVGMKKYVKAKYISRDDYQKCVLEDRRITRSFVETAAEDHEVVSCRKSKTVLSPGDKKRCILVDKVNTLAWGYQK